MENHDTTTHNSVPSATESPAVPTPAAEVPPKLSAAILKQKQAAAAHVKAQADLAAAQQERQALAAEKAQIAADKAAVAQARAAQDAWEAEFKQDPRKALEKRGLTYAQYTQMELEKQVTPEFKIEQLRKDLETERNDRQNQTLQERKAAEQQAVQAYKADIAKHVTDKAAEYPYIAALEQSDLIFETIDEHARRTNKVMDIDEAAKLVEAYLTKEAQQLIGKLPKPKESAQANSESADKGTVDPSDVSATPSDKKWADILPAPRKLKGKPTTLSNALGATISPSVVNKPKQSLTVEQWIAKQRK